MPNLSPLDKSSKNREGSNQAANPSSDTRQKPRGIEHTLRETVRRIQSRPRSLHVLSTTQRLASKHRHPEFAVVFSSVRTVCLATDCLDSFRTKDIGSFHLLARIEDTLLVALFSTYAVSFARHPKRDEDQGTSSKTTLASLCRVGYIPV